ncbi:hypothetical protein [Burkholderia metallica]|uniref:hypothetical protein n=1 Tax=Burkholderia metallica TaxID=488729 RepID=UPI001CF3EA95|nr:hypothetical protein [Burkholderia metallica]MCA8018819.1 hypothetical protein [Burkholderia metallica]
MQHEYLIFQIQQNRAVDHAKELDPVAFVIQPIRRSRKATTFERITARGSPLLQWHFEEVRHRHARRLRNIRERDRR